MPSFSLRVFVTVMLTVVAVATAAIVFSPIYTTGIDSVKSTAKQLRGEISTRLALQLKTYFDYPMAGISNIAGAAELGLINGRDALSTVPLVCDFAFRFGIPAFTGNENGEFLYCYKNASADGGMSASVRVGPTATTFTDSHVVSNVTKRLGRQFHFKLPAFYDVRLRPWYATNIAKQSWTSVYVDSSGFRLAITAGTPLVDLTLGRAVGVFACDITTATLLEYLRTIRIAKSGIALLVETSSRNVLGSSWDSPSAFLMNRTANNSEGTWRMARVVDFRNHSLLDRVVGAIGEDVLFTAKTPASLNVGTGRDVIYVDIVTLSDNFGLDLRLMIAVPELDFLEDVYGQVGKSIGGAAGAVVGLIIVGAVATFALLRPLKRLEQRMYDAASFTEDDDADTSSMITEVKNMQEAFEKMQAQLKKVKSYLPKSVLAALDGENDDDEGEVWTGERSVNNGRGSVAMDASTGRPSDVGRKSTGRNSEASSQHSSRSRGSAASGGVVGVRTLNLAGACTRKRISIVHFNLRGFHAATFDMVDVGAALQRQALQTVESVSSGLKGVLDFFNGDHISISFNACTNAAAHAVKAVHCAREILAAMEKLPSTSYKGCSIGVANGDAVVGNMGTDSSKRFCIVGHVYQEAVALERFCRPANKSLLVSTRVIENVTHEFYHENVDVVMLLPSTRPHVIATIVGAKTGGPNDEWMYEMERADAADGGAQINEAMARFAKGDLSFVTTFVAALVGSDKPGAKRLLAMAASSSVETYIAAQTSAYCLGSASSNA